MFRIFEIHLLSLNDKKSVVCSFVVLYKIIGVTTMLFFMQNYLHANLFLTITYVYTFRDRYLFILAIDRNNFFHKHSLENAEYRRKFHQSLVKSWLRYFSLNISMFLKNLSTLIKISQLCFSQKMIFMQFKVFLNNQSSFECHPIK